MQEDGYEGGGGGVGCASGGGGGGGGGAGTVELHTRVGQTCLWRSLPSLQLPGGQTF